MRFDTRQFGDQPFEFLVSHSNNRVYLQDAWATTLRCYVEAEPPNRFGVEGEGEDFTSTFLVATSFFRASISPSTNEANLACRSDGCGSSIRKPSSIALLTLCGDMTTARARGQATAELGAQALDHLPQEGNGLLGVMHVAGSILDAQDVARLGRVSQQRVVAGVFPETGRSSLCWPPGLELARGKELYQGCR